MFKPIIGQPFADEVVIGYDTEGFVQIFRR